MSYRLLATGSSGNSLLVENILIDAGLNRKRMSELVDLNSIEYVLVSHHHDDHCNLPFLRYCIQEGKQMYLPQGVIQRIQNEGKLDPLEFQNVTIIKAEIYQLGDYSVKCRPQKHHDIINYSFEVEKTDFRLLYSTDLDTLSKSDKGDGLYELDPFDVIFLEGNYDEEWLRTYIISTISSVDDEFDYEMLNSDELNSWVRQHYRVLPKSLSRGLFRAVQNMRHLSKQQARVYVQQHLKPGGKYYEIHRSSMFYEQPNDWESINI